MPLSRRPFGIESFRVAGCVGTETVYARWDGRWVWASQSLWASAQVAIAVDEVFIDAGIDAWRPSWVKGGPEELMLAMLTCCEQIDVAEYELHGNRRVVSV
jgi:hypothetical protein